MKNQPVTYHPRPAPGTRTGRVWEVADRISEDTGRRASRQEVLIEIAKENGNLATANTQYQYWKSAREASIESQPAVSDRLSDVAEQSLKVAPDGRLLIPREMRDAMLLETDGQVAARVEAGELRVTSRKASIRLMQTEARQLKKPGESVVDQFLAERPAIWGQD